jgi:hypothetical protein
MKKVIRKNIADVKLPKDWGKIIEDSSKMPESKVRFPEETSFRAFPAKSFDAVLQPIVDTCIEEIEEILKVWTKTR